MKFKSIIVEDEAPACQLLQMYLGDMPEFETTAAFNNAFTAFSYLQSNTVDLMFLDIQMPRMTGLELLRSLKFTPKVILTTAYREYALDAFELDVIDYLLKPISQERFLRSISKFHSSLGSSVSGEEKSISSENAYVFIKVGKEQIKIYLKDILFIEGFKDFIKVYTAQKMFVAYDRLRYMEEKLPESQFMRIHKSFIVARERLDVLRNESVKIGDFEIPIGRVYRQNFMAAMSSDGKHIRDGE